MRAILTSMMVVGVCILGAGPAGAQPPITTCALSGVYVLSAAVPSPSAAQLSGQFTFTPPPSCAAGAPGTVQVQFSALLAGNPTPTALAASLPYSVTGTGDVTIGSGIIRGSVAGLSPAGIANVLTFEADPGITPSTVRLAGTAVLVNLDTGARVLTIGAISFVPATLSSTPTQSRSESQPGVLTGTGKFFAHVPLESGTVTGFTLCARDNDGTGDVHARLFAKP